MSAISFNFNQFHSYQSISQILDPCYISWQKVFFSLYLTDSPTLSDQLTASRHSDIKLHPDTQIWTSTQTLIHYIKLRHSDIKLQPDTQKWNFNSRWLYGNFRILLRLAIFSLTKEAISPRSRYTHSWQASFWTIIGMTRKKIQDTSEKNIVIFWRQLKNLFIYVYTVIYYILLSLL